MQVAALLAIPQKYNGSSESSLKNALEGRKMKLKFRKALRTQIRLWKRYERMTKNEEVQKGLKKNYEKNMMKNIQKIIWAVG